MSLELLVELISEAEDGSLFQLGRGTHFRDNSLTYFFVNLNLVSEECIEYLLIRANKFRKSPSRISSNHIQASTIQLLKRGLRSKGLDFLPISLREVHWLRGFHYPLFLQLLFNIFTIGICTIINNLNMLLPWRRLGRGSIHPSHYVFNFPQL